MFHLGVKQVDHIIGDFASHVREALGPKLVDLRVFGSVARGTAEARSDIDVMVVVQPAEQRRELADQVIDIAFDLNVANDVYISPRVLTSEFLGHPVWKDTPFVRTVMREGIRI